MKKNNLLVFLGFLFITISSCKKNDDSNSSACPNSFGFLKSGNTRTFNFQNYLNGSSYTFTEKLDSTSQPGVYKLTNINFTNDGSSVVRYLKGCDGWLLSDNIINVRSSSKYFKENRAVGDAWVYRDQDQDNNDYKVIKINVSVTVPAGNFICDELLYNVEGSINTDTVWFNNNYSIIKYSGAFAEYELASKNF